VTTESFVAREDAGDGIAVLTMDDGKANAFDLDAFAALDAAFDACADAAAVVLAGRPGFFSGGLNLKTMAALDAQGMLELLVRFGRTMHRIWLEPRPVVAAVTGHAVAGGTILSMCADHAVAADGEFRWGLTETTIGFAMPEWIITIARGNVRSDRLDDLVLPGAVVGPAEAVAVGYADALAAPEAVLDAALERARALAGLPGATYAATKRRLRGAPSHAAVAGIVEDLSGMLGLGG
jgi:enoyl-CoA hydratase